MRQLGVVVLKYIVVAVNNKIMWLSLKGLCHHFYCYFKKPKDIYISGNPKIWKIMA